MFRRDLYSSLPKHGRAFGGPGFELSSMGIGANVGDHEVCEMAEFVRYDIEQALAVVDDFLGKFDGSMVSESWGRSRLRWIRVLRADGFPFPVCSSSSRIEFLAPNNLHTSCTGCHFCDLTIRDLLVELFEEGISEFMPYLREGFLGVLSESSLFDRTLARREKQSPVSCHNGS